MSAPCGPQSDPGDTPECPAHGPQMPHVCISRASESHVAEAGPRDAEAVVVALLQEQYWDDSSMIVGSAHFEDNVHIGGAIPIYDRTTNKIGRGRSDEGGVETCSFVERNEFDVTVLDGLVHITKKESANDCHIRRAAHAGLPPFGTHTSWSWHALAVGGSQTTLHHEDQIRLSVPNSAYNSSIVFQLKYFEQGTCNLPPLLKRREKHTLVRK